MTDGAYRVRNGIFGAERRYRLTRDALCWAESGRLDGRLTYADTRSLRLMSYASPIGRALQCTLKGKAGDKVIIRSAHYVDLDEFEDRSERYGPFVRELTTRIAKANPNAKFTAGSTLFWIAWLAIGAIWAVVLAFFSVALFETSLLAGLAIALSLGAICLPLIWHEVRQGGSRSFDPLNPPIELVGAQSADARDGASSSDR
ncbi:MAG: hypothetical protein AAF967_04465 [Pseudomonadota bacterium]